MNVCTVYDCTLASRKLTLIQKPLFSLDAQTHMCSDAHACRLFSPAYTLLPPHFSQLAVFPRLSQDCTISQPFRSTPNLMSLCHTCSRLELCMNWIGHSSVAEKKISSFSFQRLMKLYRLLEARLFPQVRWLLKSYLPLALNNLPPPPSFTPLSWLVLSPCLFFLLSVCEVDLFPVNP